MFLFELFSDIAELLIEKIVLYMIEFPDGSLAPFPFIPTMMTDLNSISFSYCFDTERQKEIFNKIYQRNDGWVYKYNKK